ncbi:hypothetical protein AB3S75_019831 [Citrus x aurantiifolia]
MVPQAPPFCNLSSFISYLSFITIIFLYIFLFSLALWLLVSLYCYAIEVVIWLILERRNPWSGPGSLIDIMIPDPDVRFTLKLAAVETGNWLSGLIQKFRGDSEETQGLCPQELPVSLPQMSYKNGETEMTSNTDCAICLDDFIEGEICKSFPECSHIFHLHCIDQWLKHRLNCPVCRNPLCRNLELDV